MRTFAGMKQGKNQTAVLALTSFAIYFSMYALRKPFAAGGWPELLFDVPLKIWLVSAQLLGYAAAKWWGIRVVSSLRRDQQKFALWCMFALAYVGLLALGILPAPFKLLAMFTNGLALGMVWGVLFRYIEGRRSTEFLGVFLSCSFVVSSGAVKSIGLWTISVLKVPEAWMPLVTGLLFLPVLWLGLRILDSMPPPSKDELSERTERIPMGSLERKTMLRDAGVGVGLLSIVYVLLSMLRDIRDNFAVELWEGMGVANASAQLTQSEWPITIVVLAVFAGITRIKNNSTALELMLLILLFGSLLVGASTWAYDQGFLNPFGYMFALGLGIYLAYIPITSILFDRLIAALQLRGNVGFLIYIADASGYLGATALMFLFQFQKVQIPWIHFMKDLTYIVSLSASVLVLFAMGWFRQKKIKKTELTYA